LTFTLDRTGTIGSGAVIVAAAEAALALSMSSLLYKVPSPKP